MSILGSVLFEEKSRLESLLSKYKEKFSYFPKGSVSLRKISGKSYAYRVYRESGKVHSDYLGSVEDKKVQKALEEKAVRLSLKEKIKKVKQNLEEVEGALRGISV
jgi:hypothetical protein